MASRAGPKQRAATQICTEDADARKPASWVARASTPLKHLTWDSTHEGHLHQRLHRRVRFRVGNRVRIRGRTWAAGTAASSSAISSAVSVLLNSSAATFSSTCSGFREPGIGKTSSPCEIRSLWQEALMCY